MVTDVETNAVGAPLRIQMFGGFVMTCGECIVSESSNRSYQLWNLLEYLVAHRHSEVTQTELIEALWPDDTSDNPLSALKNLVYRIRTTLAAANFPGAKDFIQFTNGTYAVNKNLDCTVDVEEFDHLATSSENPDLTENQRVEQYQRMVELYQGRFLPRTSHEPWVVPMATYYHGCYLRAVNQLIMLLRHRGDHAAISTLCESVLLLDQFEENIYEELIRSLIVQNKQKRAMDCYQHASDFFYREMGVKLSESMRNLYREIIKTVNAVEADLDVIKEDMREASSVEGAFICEYEVLKRMYRLEARSASRTGQAVFVGLLTLESTQNSILQPKVMEPAMDKLAECIRRSLRRGDVAARFSATQYVTMLPCLTYEDGLMVLGRIAKAFNASHGNPWIELKYTLQPLDPIPT